jgi:peptide deformylase
MSELLTIDTGAGFVKQEKVDPLPLYDDNHPMLKIKIPEYEHSLPNSAMTQLVKRLKMTMKKFGGIGLSANQCGVFERVFVLGTDEFQLVCINPKVIESSESTIKMSEGCLSYPGLFLNIDRSNSIVVEFVNEKGETVQTKMEGVTARAFLHELDHMNGVRFVDHVGPVSLRMAKKRQLKLNKKVQKAFGLKNVSQLV